MLFFLLLHVVAAVLAPLLVRWWGRQAFLVLALVPAAAFGWVLAQFAAVTAGQEVRETTPWIPTLDLDIALRLDPLALAFALVVTGVGALVLVYCARYFEPGDDGIGRFAANLTAFAGSMLGLVLADDLLLLYVFWELTTVFSFLLIGGGGTRLAARRAASQALILTTAGGLAMLVGLLLIGEASGSYLLSEVVADPGSGTAMVAGTLLVLVGAVTKSAMVPFHFWLPAAMEAPTPVSAYLHAAAMVKAGIYLVARLAPGLADLPGWRPVVLGLGAATMLVGGYRAIRQTDLKLLLAFGTVSQLGFLMVLVGGGSHELAAAGLAMCSRTPSSSPPSSSPSGSSTTPPAPATCGSSPDSAGGCRCSPRSVAWRALSMAGVPPLLGFVGKEAAFTALLDGGLPDPTAATVELAVLVLGSALTAAYIAALRVGRVRPQARPARSRAGRARAPAGRAVPRRAGGAGARRARLRPGQPAAGAAGRRVRRDAAAARARGRGAGAVARLAARTPALGGQPARRCGPLRRPHAGQPPAAPVRGGRLGRRGLLERHPGPRPASRCWSPAPRSGAPCRPTSARSWSSSWRCPARCCSPAPRGRTSGAPGTPRCRRWSASSSWSPRPWRCASGSGCRRSWWSA